jgi:chemotaxis protein MotB
MAGGRRGRKGAHDDHEEHFDESWLVSYADMMTLLVALFMVLFSISSVNISKFEDLQRSLASAFSGRVLPGGTGLQESATGKADNSVPTPIVQLSGVGGGDDTAAQRAERAKAEDKALDEIKKAVDAAVAERGLGGKVKAQVSRRGLEVRLLTDGLVFDSGSAVVKPQGAALLRDIAEVLRAARNYPVVVEGHTDDVPISSAQFPTNWELSSARATGVVRTFTGTGMGASRLTAQGRADLDPVGPNASEGGRALNRRVEILLPRQFALAPEAAEREAAAAESAVSGSTPDLSGSVRPAPPQIRPDATEASSR